MEGTTARRQQAHDLQHPNTSSSPTAQAPPCCWTDQKHPMSPSEQQKAQGMQDNLLNTAMVPTEQNPAWCSRYKPTLQVSVLFP